MESIAIVVLWKRAGRQTDAHMSGLLGNLTDRPHTIISPLWLPDLEMRPNEDLWRSRICQWFCTHCHNTVKIQPSKLIKYYEIEAGIKTFNTKVDPQVIAHSPGGFVTVFKLSDIQH